MGEAKPEGGRAAEIGAATVAIVLVLLVEAIFFTGDRLRQDIADIITMGTFGGVLAAVIQEQFPATWARQKIANAALGAVAGLAILHGTQGDVLTSGWMSHFWQRWSIGWSLLLAFLVALLVSRIASMVQSQVAGIRYHQALAFALTIALSSLVGGYAIVLYLCVLAVPVVLFHAQPWLAALATLGLIVADTILGLHDKLATSWLGRVLVGMALVFRRHSPIFAFFVGLLAAFLVGVVVPDLVFVLVVDPHTLFSPASYAVFFSALLFPVMLLLGLALWAGMILTSFLGEIERMTGGPYSLKSQTAIVGD